ncbi:MAG: PKD domain-containing protein [Candidatus Scalindua sp.]|jgi:chitodextrinase|nr:PKD domain-containing protein [Candidatus Scalindua sp.]
MKKILFFAFVMMVAVGAGKSFAYTVPEDDTNVEFMYVTGPEGDPLRGAEDHTLTLNIDVPEDEEGAVKIGIYDPDTGGDVDARIDGTNSWDTKTVITLSGKDGEISKKKFTDNDNYDSKFYYFDSLSKTDGKKVGSYYRFTVEITAVSGDDANLFKAEVSPASVKVSSPNITFRLVDEEGTAMHFYPLVPAGIDQIVVSNYDLDHDGGVSSIHDNNQNYELEDSTSGQWHDTVVNLSSTKERYLDYKIIKGTQFWAHAGIRITDKDGNPIPIYFRKKNMGGCDEFTFDATSSFDPDNQALVYHWDFGDGTVSEEPIVTHRFPKGGEYNVILSVQDNSGLECDTAVSSQVVSVNTPPVADFTGPGIACTEQTVTFDASGSTDNTPGQLSYLWSFGDGTSAEGKQVTKVFNKGGTYNVNLDVNDNSDTICNADNARSTITINTKPVASAGDDIDLCLPHNEEYSVNFNGSDSIDADGNDLNYRWDFGDGSSGSGSNITHVYQNRGEYVATLFVDDGSASACSSDSDSVNVKLNKAPVAIAGPDIAVCQGTAITFDGSNSIGEEGEQL